MAHMPTCRYKIPSYANVNPALGFDVVDEHCQHHADTSNAAPSKCFKRHASPNFLQTTSIVTFDLKG